MARQALPEVLHERLSCAVALVRSGACMLKADATWEVQSATTEGKTYAVNGSCSCEDARYRAPLGRCNHKLAVFLSRKILKLTHAQAHVTAEAPQEVVKNSSLPEAPASVNLKVLLHGHEVMVTLRDHDEGVLLARLQEFLKSPSIKPVPKTQPRQQWRKGR